MTPDLSERLTAAVLAPLWLLCAGGWAVGVAAQWATGGMRR